MRVFLDENMPRQIGRLLTEHEVSFAELEDWKGKENGELLALVGQKFDVFVTSDRNLPFQQNLAGKELSLVVVPTNRLALLRANELALRSTLDEIAGYDSPVLIVIDWTGRRSMRRLDGASDAFSELQPVPAYTSDT